MAKPGFVTMPRQLQEYGGLNREAFIDKWKRSPDYRDEHGTEEMWPKSDDAWAEEMARRKFLDRTKWSKEREKQKRGTIEVMGPNMFRDEKSGYILVGDPGSYFRGEEGKWIIHGGRRKTNPDGSIQHGPWRIIRPKRPSGENVPGTYTPGGSPPFVPDAERPVSTATSFDNYYNHIRRERLRREGLTN